MSAGSEKNQDGAENVAKISRFEMFRRNISEVASSTHRLLTTDVWDVETSALPYLKRKLVRFTRIFTMIGKGFKQDECGLHSSSLTFMTLLSFVPVLALAISVVKGVSNTDVIRQKSKEFVRSMVVDVRIPMVDKLSPVNNGNSVDGRSPDESGVAPGSVYASAGQSGKTTGPVANGGDSIDTVADVVEEVVENLPPTITVERVEKLIDSGFDKVEGLNFGALGGIGLIFLFWTIIAVLGDVEAAFNKVWGVTKERSLARKFTDYLSVLVIFPVLAVAASSMPILDVIQERLNRFDSFLSLSATAGWPVFKTTWVLVMMTLAFSFIMIFTPNTKVKMKPGIIGGFVCAIGFGAWMKICVALQVGVAKYSTLFGGFAIVPIILSWVFVNWQILLFSAEVSYAFQNVDTYRKEMGWRKANQKSRLMLAISLLRECAKSIASGDGLLRTNEFSKAYLISPRLVRDVVGDLQKAGVLVETAIDTDVFAVCIDIESYTTGDVLREMLDVGVSPIPLGVTTMATSSSIGEELERALAGCMDTKIKDLPENIPAVTKNGR